MKKIIVTLTIFFSISFVSCYKHKWETLHPNGQSSCDTSGVISYSVAIQPMIQANCGFKGGCHNSSLGLGLGSPDYSSYPILKTDCLNGLVMAGTSASSGNPTHTPTGISYLVPCDTLKLRKWIINGCPQ